MLSLLSFLKLKEIVFRYYHAVCASQHFNTVCPDKSFYGFLVFPVIAGIVT